MPRAVSDRPETLEFIERRRALGQDRYDEVWEGVYHVAPEAHFRHGLTQVRLGLRLAPLAEAAGLVLTGSFNLGMGPRDYRVPDFGLHETEVDGAFVPTAVVVGEVLSPGDETWEKLPFYAARGVAEVFVVDPVARSVRVLLRADSSSYRESDASVRLNVSAEQLAAIRWPTV